ncbi:MAG: transposase InsO family protein [Planctomycetota bacterium]|jgi:transposase InsO family protein
MSVNKNTSDAMHLLEVKDEPREKHAASSATIIAYHRGSVACRVYLKAYDNVGHARHSLDTYFRFYNEKRRHQSLVRQTPDSVYYQTAAMRAA